MATQNKESLKKTDLRVGDSVIYTIYLMVRIALDNAIKSLTKKK